MDCKPLAVCIVSVIDHRGLTPKKLGGDWCKQGYRALSAKNIKDGKLVQTESMKLVDEELYRRWMPQEIEEGDVFITSEAPFGEVLFWNSSEKLVLSQRVFGLKPNHNICDARYLYYWMKGPLFQGELRGRATGTTVIGLRQPELLKCGVALPSMDTQKRISAVLGAIDDKIESNAKLNGYLLECMKANYRTLFAYEQTAYGSIYDIADVVYGAAFKSALFNEDGNGYPLIRIRDLTTYEPQYWTDEAHPKRTFIEPGDVVAGMDAEFSPTFWLGEKAVLNQRVCLFRPAADTAVSPSYLLLALSPLLAFIQNYATGTTVAHMGKGDLEALEVPLPLESDLKKFNAVAEPMRKQIVHNALENKRLTALRDALLPKLMSGEIDVSEVDLTQLNSHLA